MLSDAANPYEILGIDRDAAPAMVKKAYRQLSLKYHPDRNADPDAEEDFKRLTEAYGILSNEEKRNTLDGLLATRERFGLWALPLDIRISLEITLKEAFLGGKKKVQYLRSIMRGGNPTVTMASIEVAIPRRCGSNTTLKIADAGNVLSATQIGHLYVMINYPREEEGVRVDHWGNLIATIYVPWVKALRRDKVAFSPFANSESFEVALAHGLKNGSTYTIPNAGMRLDSSILVQVFYTLPVNMSDEDCEKIAEVLQKYA